MSTLVLRLAGPLQAWGDESKYEFRGTRLEPTKSGIIGMIAAALGYYRDSSEIAALAERLRLGVRVDQPGKVVTDFHTARAPKYSSNRAVRYDNARNIVMEDFVYVTKRMYLCDAVFIVGIECDDNDFLRTVYEALCRPVFSLYLGRRSCPVTFPLVLGIRDGELENVLETEAWAASETFKRENESVVARMMFETKPDAEAWYLQMDQPISFNPMHRMYSLRGVNREQYIRLGRPVKEHDPIAVL